MMKRAFCLMTALTAALAANNNVVAVNLLGIDGGTPNILYNFIASNPALVKSQNTIQGLLDGESLLSISRYPNSTDFYGVSNNNKVYHLNSTTATATYTSTLSCDVRHSNPTLSTGFSDDGSLHIITLLSESTTNHFVANLQSGDCQSQSVLAYPSSSNLATPSPAGVAYHNGQAYVVDANANSVLSTINGQALSVVGSLNHQFSGVGGFTVASDSGRFFGLAALYSPYSSALWAINLNTGSAFQAATLGALTTNLLGFAVLANAEGIDYPFPYLGTSFNPEASYEQPTGSNTAVDALFGTSPVAQTLPPATGSGNTGANGNTGASGNTGANGNTDASGNTGANGNTGNTASNGGSGNTNGNNGGNTASTGSSGSNGQNTAGNTVTGTQGVTGSTYTATVNTPSISETGSSTFTTQVTTAGTDRQTATEVGTVVPIGTNGFTQSVSFTETIAAYDYRGASEVKTAIVVLASGEQPRAGFTGTVLVGAGTNTVVEEAGIAIPAGVSGTIAVNEGSSTVEGVLLINGAAAVTVGQLSDVSAGQTTATAVVTIADDQGRTSNGVASFVLPSAGTNVNLGTFVNRGQNSASSVIVCIGLLVAAIFIAM